MSERALLELHFANSLAIVKVRSVYRVNDEVAA